MRRRTNKKLNGGVAMYIFLSMAMMIFYFIPMTLWTSSLMERVFNKDTNIMLDFLIVVIGNAFILPVNIILEIFF